MKREEAIHNVAPMGFGCVWIRHCYTHSAPLGLFLSESPITRIARITRIKNRDTTST